MKLIYEDKRDERIKRILQWWEEVKCEKCGDEDLSLFYNYEFIYYYKYIFIFNLRVFIEHVFCF